MTKRITVSVPDELNEKMEKWKDSFNYSRIFQEAVSEVLERKERFLKNINVEVDMEELAERFIKEEKEDVKIWEAKGASDALLWIKRAQRKEILRALKVWELYDNGYNILDDSILGEYFGDIKINYEFDGIDCHIGYWELPDDFLHWFIGWTDGVEQAWQEIGKIISAKKK